ncbi:MAG: hypothetical protein Q4G25_14245 [Paracoccus sp. (in: a-proteobacteria)]|nr:hypothetical protein [Paracoccus sp. (in: a-proteobacteria)]
MKFSSRYDKEIPAGQFFDAVSDFDRIERMMMRRGVQLTRVQDISVGTRAWDLVFDWRGKRRELRLVLVQFDRPERLALTGDSKPFELRIDMSVVALSRQKSRLIFEMEIRPRNMRARLALQTAKLGKAQINRRLSERIGDFVDVVTA